MTTVVFMVVLGWVAVALLAGIVIGSAIHLADEHEQPETADYVPTEVWL